MRFFLGLPPEEDGPAVSDDGLELLSLPDWETLPYDLFSPHQDIISRRIRTLHRLPATSHGVLVVPARTLMHRLPPVNYLQGNTLLLEVGQSLDIKSWRMQLEAAGYRHAENVYEHGEYAVRGAILDIFPMGASQPTGLTYSMMRSKRSGLSTPRLSAQSTGSNASNCCPPLNSPGTKRRAPDSAAAGSSSSRMPTKTPPSTRT